MKRANSYGALPCLLLFGLGCGVQNDNADLTTEREIIEYDVAAGPVQTTGWSCGPNAASKLLRYYGHTASYSSVKAYSADKIPFLPFGEPGGTKLGSTVYQVKEYLENWEKTIPVNVVEQGQLTSLIREVKGGKPIIALVQSGVINTGLWQLPQLHWIVVGGYNSDAAKFKIFDPGFPQPYWESRSSFLERWNWQASPSLAESIYSSYGYLPKTYLSFSRPPR